MGLRASSRVRQIPDLGVPDLQARAPGLPCEATLWTPGGGVRPCVTVRTLEGFTEEAKGHLADGCLLGVEPGLQPQLRH